MKAFRGIVVLGVTIGLTAGCANDSARFSSIHSRSVAKVSTDSALSNHANYTVFAASLAAPADATVNTVLVTLGPGDDLRQMIKEAPSKVLIDFHADWCGPCRSQGKILRKLEPYFRASNNLIVKVNIDEHPQLAEQFRVSSLPTLVVVRNFAILKSHVGYANENKVVSLMEH